MKNSFSTKGCHRSDFDLKAHSGKGQIARFWFFFSFLLTIRKQANTLLEVNASQRDKDFILARPTGKNWEEYVAQGKRKKAAPLYITHNCVTMKKHTLPTSYY